MLLSLSRILSLIFFDIPHNSFKVGCTFVMIMEDSIPNVEDKSWIVSIYVSTSWSMSFFKSAKEEDLSSSFFICESMNFHEICELLLLPSHCAAFVAQFGIPQVSLMKDHSHLP